MLDPLVRLPEFRSATQRKLTPITLIGGFLGAGKTTLLNSLIGQAGQRRFAVVVNDFGELNIDAQLVVPVGDDVAAGTLELSNGCICCTRGDDLVAAIFGLLDRPQPPEHILIETSGVSDPLNIVFTFITSWLRERCFVDNVVTVVDAVHAGDARHEEYWRLFARQIEGAYTVVLNKVDIAGPQRTAWTRDLIEELIPDAQIIESRDGSVSLPLLIDDERASSFRPLPVVDHSVHPFASVAWRTLQPLRRETFQNLLGRLRGRVFRAKGLIHFEGERKATIFQMVGNLLAFTPGPPWGRQRPSTELVFIGSPERVDRNELLLDLQTCLSSVDAG